MSRLSVLMIAAVVAVVAAVGGRYVLNSMFAPDAAQTYSVGSIQIGGPFSLVNQDGEAVTDQDYRGKYMLIYFGYTFCPDVCPTSLGLMSEALDLLGEKADKITPIFISVDPDRDTPALLKSYVPNFHEKLIGLTGTEENIKAVSKAYKAYYAKVNEDDADGNYLVDHSSITYLMGPDGEFVTHFSHGTPGEDMAKKIGEIL